jgi:hypothetical protein
MIQLSYCVFYDFFKSIFLVQVLKSTLRYYIISKILNGQCMTKKCMIENKLKN